MNKFYFLFLFFGGIIIPVSAQSPHQPRLDSLKAQFQKDSAYIFRFKKIRPFAAIDQRYSWVKNTKGRQTIPVNINGFQAGVILGERHTVGFGLYSITNQSKKPVQISDQSSTISYQELILNYATLFYQYVIFDTRFFEMDLPLEIGLGRYNYNLKNESQTILLWREAGPLRLTGGGVNIILKPFRWIGINGMAGYRIVRLNKKSNLDLNGLYYSYGVWVDLRQIYRDIKFYFFLKPNYRKKVRAILTSPS